MCWGRGAAGGEGPGGPRACLSPCVSAASPSLSVSKCDFMCPPCAHIIPCTSPRGPQHRRVGPSGVHCRLWVPTEAWGWGAAHMGGWDPPRPAPRPPPPHRARAPLSGSSLTSLLSSNTAVSWPQGLCTHRPPRPGKLPLQEARPSVGQSFVLPRLQGVACLLLQGVGSSPLWMSLSQSSAWGLAHRRRSRNAD